MAATKNTKAFYNTQIPSDWDALEFGEVFTFLKTYSFSREQLSSEPTIDEIRNIHYGDIHATYENEILDLDVEKTVPYLTDGLIDPKSFEDENFPALKDGDLIIADASEDYEGICDCVELKNLNGSKIVSGLHTIAARTTESKVALGFRTYTLKHEQVIRELRRIATGISVYGVSKTNLSKLKIPLPPLPEQKAIAACLSTWDEAISKTQALIAQKELRKKWLMQQLLSEKRIVKNEKWCKSGMKRVFLKEVAKVTMGQSPNSEDYNTDAIGLPLIQGNADLSDRKQVVRYWTIQSNKECDAGDIIMTVRAPVGAIGIANHNSSIGRGVCSIKPKGIDFWYLYHLLVFKEEHWKKLEQGSTFTAVGSKDIFHFSLFIVNSIEEQTAIAQVLQAADKEISLLKAKAEKLKEQKKGLMQVLLTGKVRLKI
jgi:type I restriction enzyme S subunit